MIIVFILYVLYVHTILYTVIMYLHCTYMTTVIVYIYCTLLSRVTYTVIMYIHVYMYMYILFTTWLHQGSV